MVEFEHQGGRIRAVDGVSLEVRAGETVALVGESGCGKTTLARCVLGLQPLVSGSVTVNGLQVSGVRRGLAEHVGMVWQDPYASLDPRWTVGRTIAEPGHVFCIPIEVEQTMRQVGLDPALKDRYPHQLSGGQRQRVAIGRALALRPPLVVCDEPTAALDLSVQAQILNLLKDLRDQFRCSYLYISHDLTTVRFLADRVAVMYMGQIVEQGTTEDVFSDPRHPYTHALLKAAPSLETVGVLPEEPMGDVPDPGAPRIGCLYASRCPRRQELCTQAPVLVGEEARAWRCHFPLGMAAPAAARE